MKAIIILALVFLSACTLSYSQPRVSVFRIRKGQETITRTRDFEKISVDRYWYLLCAWMPGTVNNNLRCAIRLGYTSSYEIPAVEAPIRFHMKEIGLIVKCRDGKPIQYIGFNTAFSTTYHVYGVEFYAEKRLIGVGDKKKDLLLLGLGANMFSHTGNAVYGFKPFLGFNIPISYLANFQLDLGYHLFANHTEATPLNNFYSCLSFKLPFCSGL